MAAHRWIDFGRSYLTFTTKVERSYGRFNLQAVCEFEEPLERHHLGAMVMAGNVYADGHLFKTPPYTYQMIASARRHEILRDYGPAQATDDSVADNEAMFAEMAFNLREVPSHNLVRCSEIIAAALERAPFNARVEAQHPDGRSVSMQFPVQHINVRPSHARFQVETGPILVPNDLGSITNGSATGEFDLAYSFFNRLDQCELVLWRPMRCDTGVFRFYCERHVLEANISLLVPQATN